MKNNRSGKQDEYKEPWIIVITGVVLSSSSRVIADVLSSYYWVITDKEN